MVKIDISTKVRTSPQSVYSILKDMSKFSAFMRDVKSIEAIKRISHSEIITKWELDIDGTFIEWIEEDLFDIDRLSVKFRMIEGAFKKYEGAWLLVPISDGTQIKLSIVLDWGAPNFEKYVSHVLEEKVYRSLKSMLWLIRKRANKWTNSDL